MASTTSKHIEKLGDGEAFLHVVHMKPREVVDHTDKVEYIEDVERTGNVTETNKSQSGFT